MNIRHGLRGLRSRAALLALALLLAACGGGSTGSVGNDGGSSGTSGTSGGPGGHLLYQELDNAVWYDLSNGATTRVSLPDDSLARLGHGGGLVTEVEDITAIGASDKRFLVNLHDAASPALPLTGSLPVISAPNLTVSGPVQPSADGSLFAVHTRESGGLDDPTITDHVYVIDRQGQVKLSASGFLDPVWLSSTTLAAASGDSVFKLTLGSANPERIGPEGLGASGQDVGRLSLSPDGSALAFTQNGALWRINVDGQGLTQLTAGWQVLEWSSWSPDGARIALQLGDCAVLGTGSGDSMIAIISSTAARQDLDSASKLMVPGNAPARSCGPLYWRP